MDLQTWKDQIKNRLQKTVGQINTLAPGAVYGALSAASILPVVTAYSQGDLSALLTLGNVVSGVGGSLIASQIQAWQDRSAEDLATELSQRAESEPEWREALDTLLEELDTLRTVQTILSEADKDWLARTLNEALRAVNSRLTVAGDHIQTRDITNSTGVAVGKYITQIIHYYRQPDDTVDEALLQVQIRNYLEWICRRYGQVTLRGMQRQGQQAMELPLDTVYVPLTATTLEHRQNFPRLAPAKLSIGKGESRRPVGDIASLTVTRRIEMNELLALGNRLIVTGGPGSGKTTVLQHIAWTLATALLNDDMALAQRKLGWKLDEEAGQDVLPLPILLPISVFALYRRRTVDSRGAKERTLATFITEYLTEQQQGMVDLLPDFFAQLLRSGRYLILLLDGLDEVPDESERIRIREALERLADGKTELRMVVTCRVAAYKGRIALGRDFREVQVQPLDDDHMVNLVRQAYGVLYYEDGVLRGRQIDELLAGIRDLEAERQQRLGEDVPRLIDSPLMVRLLLIVHLNERRFPQHRAELYMRATDNLLWPDYGLEDAEALEQIREFVGQSHEIHRDLVQQIAWEMHRQGDEGGREIDEDALKRLLREADQPDNLVDNFLRLTRLRGTLLTEQLGLYRFIHLAFQEYMVARYLAEVVRGERGVPAIVALLHKNDWVRDSWWREPILLVAGYLSMNARRNAQTFLRHLAGIMQPHEMLTPDQRLAAAGLAGNAGLEWFGNDEILRAELAAHLVSLMNDQELMRVSTPRLRAAAGSVLGRLGDTRPGVGLKDGLPDIDWIGIEAGPFIMGGAEEWEGKRQFICHLIQEPYRISRYPITVAQYGVFVEAGGYAEPQYWTDAGWRWREAENITGPENYDAVFQTPNHPRGGVSWYEAVAFCNWLSEQMDHPITLPSEAQWERTARHTDGRIYPWEGVFDATRCNIGETGINSTSAVGCFPAGVAQCGAADMAGNVLEWCSTGWLESYEAYEEWAYDGLEKPAEENRRVLRGGAWLIDRNLVRCADRIRFGPHVRLSHVGFRVAGPGS